MVQKCGRDRFGWFVVVRVGVADQRKLTRLIQISKHVSWLDRGRLVGLRVEKNFDIWMETNKLIQKFTNIKKKNSKVWRWQFWLVFGRNKPVISKKWNGETKSKLCWTIFSWWSVEHCILYNYYII